MDLDFDIPALSEENAGHQTGQLDIMPDSVPHDPPAEDRFDAVGEGLTAFPELDIPIPSQTGRDAGCYKYFGFNSKGEFENHVGNSRIPKDIRLFNEIRSSWSSMHSQNEEKAERPDLPVILLTLSSLRSQAPRKLDQTLSSMIEAPPSNMKEAYAVAYNTFLNLWFNADNAFFAKRGINPVLHLDRINTLIKMFDRKKDGFRPVHRKTRNVASIQHKGRMAEQVKQRAADGKEPPSKADQDATHKARRNILLESLPEVDRARAELESKKAKLRSVQLDNPKARDGSGAKEDVAKAEGELQAAQAKYESLRKSKPKRPPLDPKQFQTLPDISKKGLNVSDPVSKKDMVTAVFREVHTEDDTNPRAYWFRDSYVIGYPKDVIDEIMNFTGTDWNGDDNEPDPTFAVGGGTAPSVGQDKDIEMTNAGDTSGGAAGRRLVSRSAIAPADAMSAGIDVSTLTPTEKAVYEANKQQAENRAKRMRYAQEIARYTEDPDTVQRDSDPGFTARLLQDTRYEGAHMTPKNNEGDGSMDDVEDINNVDMRVQIDDTTKLMDNHGYQPREYRKALEYARVASRKRPVIPGQNSEGNFNLWWQMTGSYESNRRRDENEGKAVRQRRVCILKKLPFAEHAAFTGVATGVVIADEVGVGKSDTCAASVLMVSPVWHGGGGLLTIGNNRYRCLWSKTPLSSRPLFPVQF
jgi:hypothetical protein